MFGSLVLIIALIFLPVFAPNIQTLLAGAILCGLPWGVFQTITVAYASDVTPTVLRPYLTTYVNLCWVMGQLIAAGVLRSMVSREDQWAYRLPFALQWMWPPLILVGVFIAPESPWWLVRQGRYEEAERALLKLTSRNTGVSFDVKKQVAFFKATDDLEKTLTSNINYVDCFKGVDLRRTEVTCMVWLTQAFCGQAIMGFAVQLYQRAGLSTDDSFNFNVGQYAMVRPPPVRSLANTHYCAGRCRNRRILVPYTTYRPPPPLPNWLARPFLYPYAYRWHGCSGDRSWTFNSCRHSGNGLYIRL